jgi:hypothetical protein
MSADEIVDYAKSFSCEKVLAQAKWFYEDLQKGEWREIQKVDNKSTFWIKTFPNEEIPTKVLLKYHLPLSAKEFCEVYNAKNMQFRVKWDTAFVDNELLEEYPDNGGYLAYNRVEMPWPLTDREFVAFITPPIEVEWYGKQAYLIAYMNASHKSKPANEGPYVRVTNGGQFYIITEDENDVNHACTIFSLSHNLYNGYIPAKHVEWLVARSVPKTVTKFFDSLVEGHKTFFSNTE